MSDKNNSAEPYMVQCGLVVWVQQGRGENINYQLQSEFLISPHYYYYPPLNISVLFWISPTNDSYNQFLSVEVFLARNKVQSIKLSSRGECLGIPKLQLSDVIKR